MVNARINDRHRWGIIYCPRMGARKQMKRWKEIRAYLSTKGVTYDYIQSENYGSVERLVRMLVDNGYETIVLVGGDGALQDAINGIMVCENRNKILFGLIPNGIANDFAHYWGLSSDDYKKAVDCVIARRTRKIDVGYCRYTTDEGLQKRYFLNVINIGLSAHIVEISNKKPIFPFAKTFSMLRGVFHLLFFRNSFNMKFKLNNQIIEKRFMTLSIGNSRGYGMTPSAVPYNGLLDVSAIKMPKFFGMIKGLIMVARKKLLNYKFIEPFRTSEIIIESVDNAPAGIDGRVFKPTYPLYVGIIPESFNLIIPK